MVEQSVVESEVKVSDKDEELIEVQIWNKDIKEGSDFNFTFRRPAEMKKNAKGKLKVTKRYKIERVRLISGAKHNLPRYLVRHLEGLAYEEKHYVEGAPEGKSMQVSHMRHRFAITILPPDLLSENE